MKKIIYIHSGEWPSPSPSIVFVTGTAYGLSRHAPTVLIIKNASVDSTSDIFRSITGFELPENLEIVRTGAGKKPPGHAAFYRAAVKRAGEYIKNGRAEAVISRSIGFLPYLAYLGKRYGVPCFFETHDFFGDLAFRTDLKKTVRIRKNNWYERMFLPRLDGIICLTEPQKKLFEGRYPEARIFVAPSGLLRVERGTRNRENTVCYVGSLDPHKGLGTLLQALAETADRDLGLLVVGGKNEHEMREFRDFAVLMGVGGRVRISGWVHHSDIGHMMDGCIAGVVPLSDTPFNRHITSPLKILDCFSRTLPVIGADLPSVRQYVEDGRHGLLYEPGSHESLAEALDRFAAGNLFETMSENVAAHAPRFLYSERGKTIMSIVAGGDTV